MTTPGRRRPSASRAGGPGRPRGASSAGGRTRAGRPLPAGQNLYTPGAGGTSSSVERASARPLVFLHQLPAWLPPLAMLALLITGFALPGWAGATALVLVAALLAWLGYVSWPALAARGRLLRVAAVACVLAIAVVQARR